MPPKPGPEKVRQEEVRSRLVLEQSAGRAVAGLALSLSPGFSGSRRATATVVARVPHCCLLFAALETPLLAQPESWPSLRRQRQLAEG